jgi:hypothetical protein
MVGVEDALAKAKSKSKSKAEMKTKEEADPSELGMTAFAVGRATAE